MHSVIGGRYQILTTLGQGGMGLVYKAYDPVLDRTVALKKMVATVVDGDERRARFYIEARAAARLNHPNIVTIHELEEHAGDVYIVMELLEGVSLAAFVPKRVPLSLAGTLTILAQIAEGLHYAHERAIVHRDIKPANLVLTTSGTVKILDFGIAQLASQAITKAGAMLGTPHYMSPEQIKDEPVDARADLFSLGAVAYELVTGTRPFTADSIAAVLMRITSSPHTPVKDAAPDTTPALAEIIDTLLAKDRTHRPATGAALCHALERIGDTDRLDLVAEAVRAIVGPIAEQAVYAPITPTPRPVVASTPPEAPTSATAPTPSAVPPDAQTALLAMPPIAPPVNEPAMPMPALATPSAVPPDAQTALLVTPPIAPSVNQPAASATAPPTQPPPPLPSRTTPLPAPPEAATAALGPPAAAQSQAAPHVPPATASSTSASPANLPSAPTAVAATSPAAKAPLASPQPAMLVGSGVPQARTRRGSGAALVVIVGVMLVLLGGAGWWGYVGVRQMLMQRATGASTATTASQKPANAAPDAPAAETRADAATPATPAPPSSPTATSPTSEATSLAATPVAVDATSATPTATPTASVSGPATPGAPTADAASAMSTGAPSTASVSGSATGASTADVAPPPSSPSSPSSPPDSSVAPAKAGVASKGTNGERAPTTAARATAPVVPRMRAMPPEAPSETSRVEARDAARDAPRETPRGEPRDTVRDSPRETSRAEARDGTRDAPRDPARDAREAPREAPRDPSPPETESPSGTERRQPLDAGSLAAFQRGGRSTSGAFYADAPTAAAAVARVTYTLEAYSDAIAKHDLEALREVRSPITPAETAWVKDGTTTVRFTNLDVSVGGTEAVVRCRRIVASDGKTRSSGAVEVHLTRRPAGWIITEIR